MPRRFQITRPAFKLSYDISPEGGLPLYKVKNLTFKKKNKPDLAFHDGPDKTAPIIAVCHMPAFTQNFKIGFGSPASPDSMYWEDLIKTKMSRAEHKFSIILTNDCAIPTHSNGQRRYFVWKRTRHIAVEGKKLHKATGRNWKLLDEKNVILAVFTADTKIGIAGALQIEGDYGRDFDAMVMITLLAMYERTRRD